MLNKIKRHILPMLDTLEQAVEYLIVSGDSSVNIQMIDDINMFMDAIDNAVKDESEEVLEVSAKLRALINRYDKQDTQKVIRKTLNKYINAVNAISVKYKAVFLPYYENTWDSMESVYMAFNADPMFVTEIVIVPIKRNTPTGDKHIYNDYLTPKGIFNTHYDKYSFEVDQPDFVFYNNPYDGVNYEKFASHIIKPNVGCMVYIPYFLYRHEHIESEDFSKVLFSLTELPGHMNADIIVSQGESFYNTFAEKSPNGHKMKVLGNPKVDFIVKNKRDGNWPRNLEWERVIKCKTVMMLNTHYSMLSMKKRRIHIEHIFKKVQENPDFVLIWRPHPQSFLMLDKMTVIVEDFLRWIQLSESCERIILDRAENIMPALMYSDVLISDPSSVISQWMVTSDKPILALGCDNRFSPRKGEEYFKAPSFVGVIKDFNSADENDITLYNCVYSPVYSRPLSESEDLSDAIFSMLCDKIDEFFNDIINKDDKYADIRNKYKKDLFFRVDDDCGNRILDYIKMVTAK